MPNSDDKRALIEGCNLYQLTTPSVVCATDTEFGYDLTPYKKSPHSSCNDSDRIDRGKSGTLVPKTKSRCFLLDLLDIFPIHFLWPWCLVLHQWPRRVDSLAGTSLLAHVLWYFTDFTWLRTIQLAEHNRYGSSYSGSGILDRLASAPYYLLRIVGIGWE